MLLYAPRSTNCWRLLADDWQPKLQDDKAGEAEQELAQPHPAQVSNYAVHVPLQGNIKNAIIMFLGLPNRYAINVV